MNPSIRKDDTMIKTAGGLLISCYLAFLVRASESSTPDRRSGWIG